MTARPGAPAHAFLSADWQNIVILSWPVDAALLRPYLPSGLEIDCYDGAAYISAVGLTVANSRMAGIPAGPRRYRQVNFRFYARRAAADGSRQAGVVFIRQLVPYRTIALAARLLYREPFQYAPMLNAAIPDDGASVSGGQRRIAYRWRCNGLTAALWAESAGAAPAEYAVPGSLDEFLTARYWGYHGVGGGLREYPVRREPWRLQTAADCGLTNPAAVMDASKDGNGAIGAALAGLPASALIVRAGGTAQIGWPRRCV